MKVGRQRRRNKIGLRQIKASLVFDEPPDFLFKWIFRKEVEEKEENETRTRMREIKAK